VFFRPDAETTTIVCAKSVARITPQQHPHPNPLPKGEGELKLLWNCCTTAALRSHVGSRLRKEPQISPISDALFLEWRPVI